MDQPYVVAIQGLLLIALLIVMRQRKLARKKQERALSLWQVETKPSGGKDESNTWLNSVQPIGSIPKVTVSFGNVFLGNSALSLRGGFHHDLGFGEKNYFFDALVTRTDGLYNFALFGDGQLLPSGSDEEKGFIAQLVQIGDSLPNGNHWAYKVVKTAFKGLAITRTKM